MKKIISLVFFITMLMVSYVSAQEFTIGVENQYYMPYYSVENEEYTGFARELLDAFAKKKGYTFIYKPMPLRRLFKSLLNNKIDFKFPDNPHWQPDMKAGKTVYYSNSVISSIDGLMLLPDKMGKGMGSVKNIGTLMGFTPWPFKKMIDEKTLKVTENSNFEGLLSQAIKGRIDAAYANPVVAGYVLETQLNQKEGLLFDSSLPYTTNEYFLSSMSHQKVLDEFSQFLTENTAFIEQLKKKFKISDNKELK